LYKDGYYDDTTMVKASSNAAAITGMQGYVAVAQAMGITGSYDSSTKWSGLGMASDAPIYYTTFAQGNWYVSMVTR